MSSKKTGKTNGGSKNDTPSNETTNGNAGTATLEQTNSATAPAMNLTVPMPAPMATPMGAALPVSIVGGRIVLPDMLPDEAAEFERRRQENDAFAATIKARKEKQIAELNAAFNNIPLTMGLKKADGSPDHETFAAMYAEHRNGTLGSEEPANGSLVKTGHAVSDAIKAAVKKDLENGVANVIVSDRYKVSLPWVSGYKKELGLTKARNRKK